MWPLSDELRVAWREQEALSHRYVALVQALQGDPAYPRWRRHAPEFEQSTADVLEHLRRTRALMTQFHELLEESANVDASALEALLAWTRETTCTLYDGIRALSEQVSALRAQRGELPFGDATAMN